MEFIDEQQISLLIENEKLNDCALQKEILPDLSGGNFLKNKSLFLNKLRF